MEIAFWLLPVVAYFLFPRYLTLGSQIFIAGLFALSLDLILGYARIISLGHAAFFGVGAYTAGLLAKHGWGEPISGLAAAAATAAAVGLLTSFLVVRGQDLTRLMVTLGIGLMLYEVANRASSITGGVDGLSGVEMGKLFGVFGFGLNGKTAYLVLPGRAVHRCLLARSLVRSPFGLRLRGIREGERRMPAIGASVRASSIAIYTIGAAIAGVAGGSARADDAIRRHRLAGVPALCRIDDHAGAGWRRMAVRRADRCSDVSWSLQDYLSDLSAVYWQFWLGLLLVLWSCSRVAD